MKIKGGNKMNSDETIKQRIVDYTSWDNRIDGSKITVKVNQGNVLLEGSINTYNTSRLLYHFARLYTGAKSVKANLIVKYAIPQPADAEITSSIENSIKWDSALIGNHLKVTTVNGHVTLSGDIDAFWKKQLAEKRAASIVGVKDIKNELSIVHSKKVSDEELSKSLVNAMKANRFIDITNININVENANVNLTGTVRSFMEREEIYRVVLYAFGVNSVENSIDIAP